MPKFQFICLFENQSLDVIHLPERRPDLVSLPPPSLLTALLKSSNKSIDEDGRASVIATLPLTASGI